MRLQGIGKSVVALDGRRRPVFASNLHDLSLSAEERGGIIAQHAADAIVVGPHIGGVILHVALAVEENHGDAFVGGMGDGGRYIVELLGGNDEEVNIQADQRIYLTALPLHIIVGRAQHELHFVVEIR